MSSELIHGKSIEHGGNIYRLADELNMQERNVLDFSASVNPLGVSKKIKAELRKNLKYLHNYPDPDAKRLRKRLARYHGIDMGTILCGNGSTELIYLLTRTLKPRRVLIPAPTFSEYERACTTSCESQVASYELKEENNFDIDPDDFVKAMEGKLPNRPLPPFTITRPSSLPFDIVFLCNPNNPTGILMKKDDVLKIADAARAMKSYLVVDEAYMDFCPDESVIRDVEDNPCLIALRSLSSFYALPGLRLGYGVFPEHLIVQLQNQREPWTVNSLSQQAGVVALKDKVFRKESLKVIADEKRFFEKNFKKLGVEFFSSDAHFYLIKMDNADEICRQLRTRRILVRNCESFRGLDSSYIRISVKSHKENTILIKALASIIRHNLARDRITCPSDNL